MKINYSDNPTVAGRQLHLQTHLASDQKTVVGTLFDHGQVLVKKTNVIENGLPDDTLRQAVLRVHQVQMEQIQFLSRIRDQVINVNHAPSLVRLAQLYSSWGFIKEAQQILDHAKEANKDSIQMKLVQAKLLFSQKEYGHVIQLFTELNPAALKHDAVILLLGKSYLYMGYFDHAYAMITQSEKRMSTEFHLLASLCLLREMEKTKNTTHVFGIDQGLDRFALHVKHAIRSSETLDMQDLDYIIQEIRLQNYTSACDELENLIEKYHIESDFSFHGLFFLRYLFDSGYKDSAYVENYIKQVQSTMITTEMRPEFHAYLAMAYIMQSLESCHAGLKQLKRFVDTEYATENASVCVKICQEAQAAMADLLKHCLKTLD